MGCERSISLPYSFTLSFGFRLLNKNHAKGRPHSNMSRNRKKKGNKCEKWPIAFHLTWVNSKSQIYPSVCCIYSYTACLYSNVYLLSCRICVFLLRLWLLRIVFFFLQMWQYFCYARWVVVEPHSIPFNSMLLSNETIQSHKTIAYLLAFVAQLVVW